MAKPSSNMLQLTKRHAAFRCRQLLDELTMLIGSFPDLRNAFDGDELPLAFIMKRDSRSTEPDVRTPRLLSTRAEVAASRRMTTSGTRHRGGHRKQMSDE